MSPATTAPSACGLDFGTSNSTIGVVGAGGARLSPLEEGRTTLPSAVFFGVDEDTAFLVGRAAIAAYVDGRSGRLLRALKSVLGSSLIHERTQVFRRRVSFSAIIERYIGEVRRRAELAADRSLTAVVLGRPVHFVDDDASADRHAEDELARIAARVGFKDVSFQFEPIAAAYDFETRITREHVALVADIGGGTSDFAVVRLGPDRRARADRRADILSAGGLRLGGTDYDRDLAMSAVMPLFGYGSRMARGDIDVPSTPFWDLATWSSVHLTHEPGRIADIQAIRREAAEPALLARLARLAETRRGHDVIMAVEEAKIALSDAADATIGLGWLEAGLSAVATREAFEAATSRSFGRLRAAARDCVRRAGLAPDAITAVFLTGGTTSIPAVRRAVLADYPDALVVEGDRFGSVGLGLTIEASRRHG